MSLGQLLLGAHAGLLHAVGNEPSTLVLPGVLRALCVMIAATPYERLPPEVLPETVRVRRAMCHIHVGRRSLVTCMRVCELPHAIKARKLPPLAVLVHLQFRIPSYALSHRCYVRAGHSSAPPLPPPAAAVCSACRLPVLRAASWLPSTPPTWPAWPSASPPSSPSPASPPTSRPSSASRTRTRTRPTTIRSQPRTFQQLAAVVVLQRPAMGQEAVAVEAAAVRPSW